MFCEASPHAATSHRLSTSLRPASKFVELCSACHLEIAASALPFLKPHPMHCHAPYQTQRLFPCFRPDFHSLL